MSEEFRSAKKEDIGGLLEIQSSWPSLPQWTREHFLHEIDSPRSRLIVLEEQGRLNGYGGLLLIPPEAQISVLAVRPDRARRGLGRRLLRRLMEDALTRSCATATLEVSAKNPGALSLYESAGFSIVGRRPKFYNDGSDAVLMSKCLSI